MSLIIAMKNSVRFELHFSLILPILIRKKRKKERKGQELERKIKSINRFGNPQISLLVPESQKSTYCEIE